VATPERIDAAAKLMVDEHDPCRRTMVVVSALGSHPTSPVKTTDLLINMVNKAAGQDPNFARDLDQINQKHQDTARLLLGEGEALDTFMGKLNQDMGDLRSMLKAIQIGASTLALTTVQSMTTAMVSV
jgi:aspartokinase/homoserine dehydrogenase 1